MRIWDVDAARELHRCEGHQLLVASVAWAPDGERLVSSSWDGTVRVWDAASGRELACLQGHLDNVLAVEWDPSGRRLASASKDGTVRIWDTTTYDLLCTLVAAGPRSLARTPGGYCLFEERGSEGPRFCLAACRPERPGSALFLPLGGLREVLHRPDKVEAALRGDLTGDGELEQDLAACGLSGGIPWNGERHVLA